MVKPTRTQVEALRAQGYETVRSVARRLCLSESGVYTAIRQGRLKAARVGGRVYVAKVDIDRLAGPLKDTP